MEVEHEHRTAAGAFNLGHEDGPVKKNGLVRRGRIGSHRTVIYWRHARMPQFAMSMDRLPREDDEIMDIGKAASAGTTGRSAMESLVRRSFDEQIQRVQRAVLFMPRALTIDLLKAEDVGAKPFELRPEDIRALLDCDAGARRQFEIFKIERGDTHRHPRPLSSAAKLSALLSYRCKGGGAMQTFLA